MAVAASALRARPAAAAPPATSIRTTVLATVVLIALPTAARFVVTQQMVGLLLVLYVAALAPWIVKSPVRGIYVAVACAAVFNITPVLIPDSLVDLVPVFMNLNNTQYSAGLPVAITPFELLLVVTTVGVIVQSGTALVTRPTGSILAAYAAYFAIVVFAEFHGLFGGGDFNTSLWELRPQAYGFMLCVLAAAAVRERRQLLTLTVVATTAITVKMLIASVRYLTVRDTSVYGEDIMAHEESFFAATILVGLIVALLFVRRRRLVLAYLALSVPAAVALLANQRRAGSSPSRSRPRSCSRWRSGSSGRSAAGWSRSPPSWASPG